jgi:hypothetical protein
LLSSLFSQPPISSPKQKYLLVIARDSDSAEDSKEGLKEIMQTTGTFSGDEISWDKLAEKCKEKEVRCSCAIIESGDGMEVMKGSRPSKRLQKFFEEVCLLPSISGSRLNV